MTKKNKSNEEEILPETEIVEDDLVSEEEILPETEIVEEKTKEEESLADQLVRLQADFTNFRNRTQRERITLYQRANEDILLELLPVLDHFEMGLETASKNNSDKVVLDGFQMILDQFSKVLDKFNLKQIDVIGKTFDPHLHEALTYVASEEFEEGVCIEQIRKGYQFGDKLLRAAQVVVSSGKDSKEKS
tara:strand:+ start:4700 stop:5269 length:570 start_codon:yes stop_codon:yes gene_type:complete